MCPHGNSPQELRGSCPLGQGMSPCLGPIPTWPATFFYLPGSSWDSTENEASKIPRSLVLNHLPWPVSRPTSHSISQHIPKPWMFYCHPLISCLWIWLISPGPIPGTIPPCYLCFLPILPLLLSTGKTHPCSMLLAAIQPSHGHPPLGLLSLWICFCSYSSLTTSLKASLFASTLSPISILEIIPWAWLQSPALLISSLGPPLLSVACDSSYLQNLRLNLAPALESVVVSITLAAVTSKSQHFRGGR